MKRVVAIHEKFHDAALAEEYIEGREFYVGVLGNRDPVAFPPAEMDFSGLPDGAPRVLDSKAKWAKNSVEFKGTKSIMPDLPDELRAKLQKVALEAYRALRVRDYGRVDLRLTETGEIYVIEVNANCYLEKSGEFAVAAEAAGIGYDELINRIVDLAVERKEAGSVSLEKSARNPVGEGRKPREAGYPGLIELGAIGSGPGERPGDDRTRRRQSRRESAPRQGPGRAAVGPGASARCQRRQGGPSRRGGLGLKRLGGDDFVLVHPNASARWSSITRKGSSSGRPATPRPPATPSGSPSRGAATTSGSTSPSAGSRWTTSATRRLARGHFGYAFELAERAMPGDFAGRLPREHPSNRPLYDAVDGLIACHEALGAAELAGELRRRLAGWSRPVAPRRPG